MLVASHYFLGKIGVEAQDLCPVVFRPLRVNLSKQPYIAFLTENQVPVLLRHKPIFYIPSSDSHGAFHQAFARVLGGRHMECAYYFFAWCLPFCPCLV